MCSLRPPLSPLCLPRSLCLSSCLSPSTLCLFFSLPSASPNGEAKLLFPSHYLICASPLSCKSSRYSSPFSINSLAVKLQLPITKHCWRRKEEVRQRQGDRQSQGGGGCGWNAKGNGETERICRRSNIKKKGQKWNKMSENKRYTGRGGGYLWGLMEATGPSASLNEGSGNQVCRLL